MRVDFRRYSRLHEDHATLDAARRTSGCLCKGSCCRVGGWYPRRHDEAVQDDRGCGSLREAFDIWRMACDSVNGPRLGKLNAPGFANRFRLVPVAMPTCWGKFCPTAGSPTMLDLPLSMARTF